MKSGGTAIAIFLAACGGGKATDDLKAPPPGGYSSVPEERVADADAGPAPDDADYVADSERELDTLRIAFVACNQPRSKTFVAGSETIALEVGSDGKIVSATPEGRSGLNDDVENCLRRVAMNAELDPPPDGKKATFKIPVQFFRSQLKTRHR